ncbi:addiction module protein [Flavobacterium taihuense]|uniref:Addiction module protein n=1 Tax=Flavobacterium taihuense TaxID=2857508 RepID=A0ABS6Y108_9FLAO|nr:addiction module protein [Flavobacterium taihuense]MBW4362287.1 addiction module protein [Flavobacterium taihuense]
MSSLSLKVDLDFQQLLDVVKQLSPSEKLKLNEAIWDNDSEIPLEHQQLVNDRIQKSKANPSRMLNWDEIKSR